MGKTVYTACLVCTFAGHGGLKLPAPVGGRQAGLGCLGT